MAYFYKSRELKTGLACAVAAISMAACGGDDAKSDDTSDTKTGAITFPSSNPADLIGAVAKGEVDIDYLKGYMPEGLVMTFEDNTYAANTGLTTLTKVRLSSEENADFGVEIGKLAMAGFDRDFVETRIAEGNFEQSAVVFDYLEASDISLFGFEAFYESINAATTEVFEDLVEDALEEDFPSIEQSFDKIDFRIDKIIIDDFEFLPFELFKSKDKDESEGEAFLRSWLSHTLAVGAKTIYSEGLSLGMDITQDGQSVSSSFSMPVSLYEGWRGGDYKLSYIENTQFNIDVPIGEDEVDFPFDTMEMSGSFGTYLIEDIRLTKAIEWLARGEMPPTSETDLLSLGKWTMKDLNVTMLGAPFYSLDSSYTDLSHFHWLIPTKIENRTENLVYDMGALVENILTAMPAGEIDADGLEVMTKSLDVLRDYDLAAPSVDFDFNWNWDPEEGDAELLIDTSLDGYGTFEYAISGAVASFQQWVKEGSQFDVESDEFDTFMAETSRLDSMRLQMNDRGGNERLYDLAQELGETLKDISPEMAVLAAYDKDTMKLLVSSTVKSGAAVGAADFPQLKVYATALSDYLAEGGIFTVAMSPSRPIDQDMIADLEEPKGPGDIQAILDEFGFSVTHQPN